MRDTGGCEEIEQVGRVDLVRLSRKGGGCMST